MPDESTPRRRTADRVGADVRLYVNDEVADSRHTLRNEFAEAFTALQRELAGIRQDVQADNLARVTERAEIRTAVSDIKDDVGSLKDTVSRLEPRVSALESGVSTDQAVERALREAKTAAETNQRIAAQAARESRRWSIGTIVSVVGMFGGYLAFFHG